MNTIGLLILGMHRSGTSALTGVLAKLGAYPGPSLVPGIAAVNAKGFWEHPGVVDIHERLLEALHRSWHDVGPLPWDWRRTASADICKAEIRTLLERDFSTHPFWVLKDPRMCRVLPMWLEVLTAMAIEPRHVIALRHPLAVAASLEKRDALPTAHGCLLWLAHMIDAEKATRGGMRTFVSYDALLDDWRATIAQLAYELQLPLQWDDPAIAADIDAFLDPALKHHAAPRQTSDHPAIACALDLYRRLTGGKDVETAVEALAPEFDRLVGLVTPWSDSLNQLRRTHSHTLAQADLQTQRATNYAGEVARIKSSLSWRITAPLRLVRNLWK